MSFLSWFIALCGTAGSLYFSEVLGYLPCSLCWYQRVFLYPLLIVILVGMIRKDLGHVFYVGAISLFGLVISIYHNLLIYGLIEKSLAPCKEGVSCAERQIDWLGFVSIPLLSLIGFAVIFILNAVLVLYLKRGYLISKGEA